MQPIKGRGAQIKAANPFLSAEYVTEHFEGLDEEFEISSKTKFFEEHPKKIINRVDSPDIGMDYSMNPYQGCEHGCVYCYARNTHAYWGFNAGIDFEQNIIVKPNAPELLEKQITHPNWKVAPIMFSGNTDCYQPVERRLGITRRMLEVLVKYRHPVGMITKNSLILRDLDLLQDLAKDNLVSVAVSINSLTEELRQKMEPRTASYPKRLEVIQKLSEKNIPVSVMVAPVIPGLNDHEIPSVIKASAERGASGAGFTIVRLNGEIGKVFDDWIRKTFPGKADKVLHRIQACHGGRLSDSRWGKRMRGEGSVAESIHQMFRIACAKYFKDRKPFEFNLSAFRVPAAQMELF
ncbi:MAG TPA: PA0069 family radical SAM protein [Chitinophagales bacterium]|nr:PA0069 family radical SAM protein [Chitinophagales bacterium]